MRTTVTVDESLVHELVAVTGARTKTAAVRQALIEQIRLAKLRRLADLLGTVDVDDAALADGDRLDLSRAASVSVEAKP